jgi:hypothetical protein
VKQPLRFLAKKVNVDVVDFLLDPSRPSSRSKDHSPWALYFACEFEKVDVVDRLLNSGFSPNLHCKERGSSPLIVCLQEGFSGESWTD